MLGGAMLAARAALRVGAGRVIAAVPSPLESSSGFDCCSMKASPGAVPFGPMSVEAVETTESVVVTVVSTS
jgi:hypothetical protein